MSMSSNSLLHSVFKVFPQELPEYCPLVLVLPHPLFPGLFFLLVNLLSPTLSKPTFSFFS
jgi:hypothetical protein